MNCSSLLLEDLLNYTKIGLAERTEEEISVKESDVELSRTIELKKVFYSDIIFPKLKAAKILIQNIRMTPFIYQNGTHYKESFLSQLEMEEERLQLIPQKYKGL